MNIIKVFSVDMGGTIEHKTEWNNSDTETEVLLICSHMHNLTKSWPESRRGTVKEIEREGKARKGRRKSGHDQLTTSMEMSQQNSLICSISMCQ